MFDIHGKVRLCIKMAFLIYEREKLALFSSLLPFKHGMLWQTDLKYALLACCIICYIYSTEMAYLINGIERPSTEMASLILQSSVYTPGYSNMCQKHFQTIYIAWQSHLIFSFSRLKIGRKTVYWFGYHVSFRAVAKIHWQIKLFQSCQNVSKEPLF